MSRKNSNSRTSRDRTPTESASEIFIYSLEKYMISIYQYNIILKLSSFQNIILNLININRIRLHLIRKIDSITKNCILQKNILNTENLQFKFSKGYIDIGDGYWRRNVLVTILRFW